MHDVGFAHPVTIFNQDSARHFITNEPAMQRLSQFNTERERDGLLGYLKKNRLKKIVSDRHLDGKPL